LLQKEGSVALFVGSTKQEVRAACHHSDTHFFLVPLTFLNLFVCHSSGFSSAFPSLSLVLCLPQLSPEQVSSEILRSLIKVSLI
jgi:hypothetical protein